MNSLPALRCTLSLLVTAAIGCSGDDAGSSSPDAAACVTTTYYPDRDGDGYGDTALGAARCEPSAGYVTQAGDCDDAMALIHPGIVEVCDLIDNDCDAKIDDADPDRDPITTATYYRDQDRDGFGDATTTTRACAAPTGYVASSTDCNDARSVINPSASEVCDDVDNDCDAEVDDADSSLDPSTARTFYPDRDGDGAGAGAPVVACSQPTGHAISNLDCDDNDADSGPSRIEICDGADNDCDGGIDGTPAQPNQCAAMVRTYPGSYTLTAEERVGNIIVNSMTCNGSGSSDLVLTRRPALQGTFECIYPGGLGIFREIQSMSLRASVALDGSVFGTIEHSYDAPTLRRTYQVNGTLSGTSLTLSGTGSLLPHPQATVPWQVTFSVSPR